MNTSYLLLSLVVMAVQQEQHGYSQDYEPIISTHLKQRQLRIVFLQFY